MARCSSHFRSASVLREPLRCAHRRKRRRTVEKKSAIAVAVCVGRPRRSTMRWQSASPAKGVSRFRHAHRVFLCASGTYTAISAEESRAVCFSFGFRLGDVWRRKIDVPRERGSVRLDGARSLSRNRRTYLLCAEREEEECGRNVPVPPSD